MLTVEEVTPCVALPWHFSGEQEGPPQAPRVISNAYIMSAILPWHYLVSAEFIKSGLGATPRNGINSI